MFFEAKILRKYTYQCIGFEKQRGIELRFYKYRTVRNYRFQA